MASQNFVVSWCLGHVSNSAHEEQYICASCDKRLKETSNENPVLPYFGKYPNAAAGANFPKTLNQRPEYVCICCHHMLFCKTVQLFNITDYEMSNGMVKECLSHWYVMKLHRHTTHENDEIRTNKWPQFSARWCETWWHICYEWIYLYTLQKHLKAKKKKKDAWPGMCKMVFSYMTSHRIYKTYFHWREEWFLHKSHS